VSSNLIGYARVSTADQNPDLQEDALRRAGAIRIFTDHASGSTQARPAWQQCLEYLQPGNVLVVWKLDRIGRSTADLARIVAELGDRGIQFKSLTESFIDTTTSDGRLIFHIFTAMAEHERSRMLERTRGPVWPLRGSAAASAAGPLR
jgi:DNA invertase Pin-like site-specific DNA recombinase